MIAQSARTRSRACVVVVLLAALASVAAVGVLVGHGVRWYVVETPSMGTAAPVGTLLVVAPPGPGSPVVGDVVTVRRPGGAPTVTHRVTSVAPDGSLRTRGDLNGAEDPGVVERSDVVGVPVVVVPHLGRALRAGGTVLAGGLVLALVTARLTSADVRRSVRLVGLAALVAVTVGLLLPVARVEVLASRTTDRGVEVDVVSTGVLPARVTAAGRTVEGLRPGSTGHLVLDGAEASTSHALSTTVDLDGPGGPVVVAACLLPTLVGSVLAVTQGRHAGRHRAVRGGRGRRARWTHRGPSDGRAAAPATA